MVACLSTAVSILPEFIAKNRNVSFVGTGSNDVNPDILKPDGTINTGYIPKGFSLLQEDKDTVAAA